MKIMTLFRNILLVFTCILFTTSVFTNDLGLEKDLDFQLVSAVEKGDSNTIKSLLTAGANVNTRDHYNDTILMIAARKGDIDVIKILLNAGADPNDKVAPSYPFRAGYYISSDREIHYSGTPLQLAATKGYTEVVKALITAKANVNYNFCSSPALINATRNGHVDVVTILLAAGALVNDTSTSGNTALIYAAEKGQFDLVTILLAAGANPNVNRNDPQFDFDESPGRHHRRRYEDTPLSIAVTKGYTDIVKALVMVSTDIEHVNYNHCNRTLLMVAAERGYTEIAKALIAAGADINAQDYHKKTALKLAEINSHPDTAKAIEEAKNKSWLSWLWS